MARLTAEQQKAYNELLRLGATRQELQDLQDAQYRASKRVEERGGTTTTRINYNTLLKSFKETHRATGKSLKQFVRGQKKKYESRGTRSTERREIQEAYGDTVRGVADSESWLNYCLSRYTFQDIADALGDNRDDVRALAVRKDYDEARDRYEATGATTQEEFDRFLSEAVAKNHPEAQRSALEALGIDKDAIELAESVTLSNAQSIKDEKQRENFIKRERRKAMRLYGGPKWR